METVALCSLFGRAVAEAQSIMIRIGTFNNIEGGFHLNFDTTEV